MNKRKAFIIFCFFSIISLVFALSSYIPESTVYEERNSSPLSTYSNLVQIRQSYTGFSALSNFVSFFIDIDVANSSNPRNLSLNLIGTAILMTDSHEPLKSISINSTILYKVTPEMEEFHAFDITHVDFSSISLFLDVVSASPELSGAIIVTASMNRNLSNISIFLTSFVSLFVTILLFFLISKRVRPSKIDQWASVVLCGFLFLVDGPWLLVHYFTHSNFCQVYDSMPQLFHSAFIVFALIFFSVRSEGTLFFKSNFVYVSILLYSTILLFLQFAITGGKPLAMFPLLKENDMLYIVLLVMFIIYHMAIITMMIYGFFNLKIEKFWSFLIIVFMFLTLETIQVITFFIRVTVNPSNVGQSSSADLFYILEANLVSFFLVYLNTPIGQSSDSYTAYLVSDDDVNL